MTVKLTLDENHGYRVVGPASVRVESGVLNILGAEIGEGGSVRIPQHRSYYLYSMTGKTVIGVELGEGARIEAPSPGEEPARSWVEAVDNLLESCDPPCTVSIVGPVESGKTSLAALIANRSIVRGLKPAIIDADIGQADIGPPGFVALSLPESWIVWLREAAPRRMVFAGHVEPGYVVSRIIFGVRRLYEEALREGADVIIVDNDGWVDGWRSLEYRLDLARAISAKAIIVAGSPLLATFFKLRWPGTILDLPRPLRVEERDHSLRRALRAENYRRFLEPGMIREFFATDTPVVNACMPLEGIEESEHVEKVEGSRILGVSRYPGGACVLLDNDEPPPPEVSREIAGKLGVKEAIVLYTGGMRNILASLTDLEGWDHPALILNIDFQKGRITVKTRYEGPVASLTVGRLRLDEEYYDLPVRRIWL